MADEVKDVVVEEGAEAVAETTESTDKKEKKGKKEKNSIDVNAMLNSAKEGVSKGSNKITEVVSEADDKKKMIIFLAIIILEVVLSAIGGVGALMLIVQAIVACVGFIALKAAFPSKKDDDSSEE